MERYLLIAAGGALGSLLRYFVQGIVQRLAGIGFPWGTFTVNISGCFLIGLLAGAFSGPVLLREEYRIGLLVGVLGGFTTFSTLGLESFQLAGEGQLRLALTNMAVSCLVGLAAVWLGYRLAEYWYGLC